MNEKDKLLLDLKRIEGNGYTLDEGENVTKYINLMLKYIGDTDPELRDDLIYSTFYVWMKEKEYLSRDEIIAVLDKLLDDKHLFYQIGNSDDDTVFTRTFSTLVIAIIIGIHRKEPFIQYNKFLKVKDLLLRYYKEEKDLRGYIGDKGWAHGAAHCADVFVELVQCRECNAEVCKEVLKAIKVVLYNGKYTLCNEEDERISRIISRIVEKDKLNHSIIIELINNLGECSQWQRDRKQFITRTNVKAFLRCLYFRLMGKTNVEHINKAIIQTEKSLTRNV